MYPVSNEFLSAVRNNSRTINAIVSIGTTIIPVEGIVSFTIEESFGSNKMPTIGGATSSILTLEILNEYINGQVLIDRQIVPEVSILANGVEEWVKLGVFYADSTDITVDKLTTTIQCFDQMDRLDKYIYSTALTYPATVNDMLDEIEANYPVVFADYIRPMFEYIMYADLEAFTYGELETMQHETPVVFDVEGKPEGTLRQVLSKIAFRLGANAIFDREGKCTFKFLDYTAFQLSAENYYDYKLLSGSPNRISQLIVSTGQDGVEPIIVGDTSGVSLEIQTNVVDTELEVTGIFNRVYPLNFYSYDMELQGMPHMEVGDTFDFTDVENNQYRFAVVFHKLEFDGGLTSTFSVANPETSEKSIKVDQTTGTIGDSIVKVSKTMGEAIKNSTSLITGNQGGHVVMKLDSNNKPQEILILADSEDINTATKVWRWNASGLGYSSTGYNGDYGLAMTADGSIVADFITTGILNADLLRAGRIQKGVNFWDLDTGYFNFGGVLINDVNGTRIVAPSTLLLTVDSSNGLSVESSSFTTTLTARIFSGEDEVTSDYDQLQINWYKQVAGSERAYVGHGYTYNVPSGITKSTTYECVLEVKDVQDYLNTFNGDRILTISNDRIVVSGFSEPVFKLSFACTLVMDYQNVTTTINDKVDLKVDNNQMSVFNALTKNGAVQGLFMDANGDLYINGQYIQVGTINADKIFGGTLVVGGTGGQNGVIQVRNASNSPIINMNQNGIELVSGAKLISDGGILSQFIYNSFGFYADSFAMCGYWETSGGTDNMRTVLEGTIPSDFVIVSAELVIDIASKRFTNYLDQNNNGINGYRTVKNVRLSKNTGLTSAYWNELGYNEPNFPKDVKMIYDNGNSTNITSSTIGTWNPTAGSTIQSKSVDVKSHVTSGQRFRFLLDSSNADTTINNGGLAKMTLQVLGYKK